MAVRRLPAGWFDVHDRRVVRGSRPSAAFDFEVDLRLGITAIARDLGGSALDAAHAELASTGALVAPTLAWGEAQQAALAWLRSLIDSAGPEAQVSGSATGPNSETLAAARAAWPQGHDPMPYPLVAKSADAEPR